MNAKRAAGLVLFACAFESRAALAASYDDPEEERYEDAGAGDTSKVDAGGLPAPRDHVEDATGSDTEKELERADAEDSGRGLSFAWLGVEGGFQHAGLAALGGTTPPLIGAEGAGLLMGAGLGARLLYFNVGPRFRYVMMQHYERWSLDLELSFRLPIGKLEPFISLDVGYTEVPGLRSDGNLKLTGVELAAAFGCDYFLSPTFSVGGQVTPGLLFLSPQGGGAATGGTLSGSLNLTLHY